MPATAAEPAPSKEERAKKAQELAEQLALQAGAVKSQATAGTEVSPATTPSAEVKDSKIELPSFESPKVGHWDSDHLPFDCYGG